MTNSFYNDEKELYKIFLDNYIFPQNLNYANMENRICTNFGPPTPDSALGIELIVRPECNQNCDYCYIARYGKELYPVAERVSNKKILENLRAVLEYVYITKQTYISRWELFAGDMFYDGLYFDILDIFYEYLKPIYDIYPQLMADNPIVILAPINFSFIKNDEQVELLKEYIAKMAKIGVIVGLSCSTDGKFATDSREKQEFDDDYWDKLLSLLKELHFRCHPMLSPENVSTWKENYDWWIDVHKTYFEEDFDDFQPMILEVRNADWYEDQLIDYVDLLKHMIQKRFEMCDNNPIHFAKHLVGGPEAGILPRLQSYDPIRIDIISNNELDRISCSLQGLLHITLNNLSIVPCHRLTYPQFIGGNFVKDDNNHIVDIEPKNVALSISAFMSKVENHPKCVSCKFNKLCLKQCWGAQYEETGEIFQPALNVCNLLKIKYLALLIIYEDMGILDVIRELNLVPNEAFEIYQSILREARCRIPMGNNSSSLIVNYILQNDKYLDLTEVEEKMRPKMKGDIINGR